MRALSAQTCVLVVAAISLPLLTRSARAQTTPDGSIVQEVVPQGSPPATEPPPPPAQPPQPPKADAGSSPQAPSDAQPATSTGQWVYTNQYGWIWIPYGDEYVFTPADESAEPYEFIYWPTRGWIWVAAPWIWGIGPLPYFGVFGPWHYHWYRGPVFHPRSAARPLFHGGYGHPPAVHGGVVHSGGGHHR
jgi:hypothetical protein